jgi:hypothetical protein
MDVILISDVLDLFIPVFAPRPMIVNLTDEREQTEDKAKRHEKIRLSDAEPVVPEEMVQSGST